MWFELPIQWTIDRKFSFISNENCDETISNRKFNWVGYRLSSNSIQLVFHLIYVGLVRLGTRHLFYCESFKKAVSSYRSKHMPVRYSWHIQWGQKMFGIRFVKMTDAINKRRQMQRSFFLLSCLCSSCIPLSSIPLTIYVIRSALFRINYVNGKHAFIVYN